jgi:hypothetical protein
MIETSPRRGSDRMQHKDRTTLGEIFAHPVTHNLAWRDVVSLFEAVGGEVTDTHKDGVKVKLAGNERTFQRPHHKNIDSTDEIVAIKKFLEESGVTPES